MFFLLFFFLHLVVKTISPKLKIVKFANNVDLDEAAHDEPPHLDRYFLLPMHDTPRSKYFFEILQM